MSQLYPNDWHTYLYIVLIFLRALGLFLLIPGFSHNAIPTHFKVLFALSFSFVLYPTVRGYIPVLDNSLTGFFVASIRETAIGFILGFTGYLLCEGIHLAAQFIGYQMGYGTAGLLEPQSQSSVSVVVHLQTWLVLVLFFVLDIHHQVIHVFVESFRVTGQLAAGLQLNDNLVNLIIATSGRVFSLAVQLAAPFTVLLLLCNVVIAILARMLPQMNILLLSFPITLLCGLVTFFIVAPELLDYMSSLLGDISANMMSVLKVL